jgi:uncharacterized protein with HEPN domain
VPLLSCHPRPQKGPTPGPFALFSHWAGFSLTQQCIGTCIFAPAVSTDDKTAFAVVRALEIIGETTKKIPEAVREIYPDLPWREMAGLRDKLAHDYFGVNLDVVWKTVTNDLPTLKSGIASVLEAESPD